MRKILLSLLVVATAVGMSSYVNAPVNAKSGALVSYGVLSEDNDWYYVTSQAGTCLGEDGTCRISTTNTPDPMHNNRVAKDANTSIESAGVFEAD